MKQIKGPLTETLSCERFRVGDNWVTVNIEKESAVINYLDILAAVEIVPDDDCEAPWVYGDGFEHRLVEYESGYKDGVWVPYYNKEHTITQDGRRHLIVIDPKDIKKWGNYDWWRSHGYSKQMAVEKVAEEVRRTYKQLKEWYTNGWERWGVVCRFGKYDESLWGIDCHDYAVTEIAPEMARQVAWAMRDDGYTITREPDLSPTRNSKQIQLRDRFAHQLGFKSSEEYQQWLKIKNPTEK